MTIGFAATMLIAWLALMTIVRGVFVMRARIPTASATRHFSCYLPMRDGTRLAIYVWLPAPCAAGAKVPTLLTATCYGRMYRLTRFGKLLAALNLFPTAARRRPVEQRVLLERGYALLLVQARGTAASFGTQQILLADAEIEDYAEVIEWVARQPWSNGRVGAHGVSYDGMTAAAMASLSTPALKAVAPLFDFADLFLTSYPGGVFNAYLLRVWSNMTARISRGSVWSPAYRPLIAGLQPVESDQDGALLAQAIRDHAGNYDIHASVRAAPARDDLLGAARRSITDVSAVGRMEKITRRGLPMYVQVGYLDASSAQQALQRFQAFSNPQKLYLGPFSHAGVHHTDPFAPAHTPVTPDLEIQVGRMADFFDQYLREDGREPREREITYYVNGAGTWRTTNAWPPVGTQHSTWYFAAGHALSTEAPTSQSGADQYRVDFAVTSGTTSRHRASVGEPPIRYPHRRAWSARLLTYTSPAMTDDLEIAGDPRVQLQLASTATDGALIVYLEDVDAHGEVTYLTEGTLRLAHRKLTPTFGTPGEPLRTYRRADMAPMVPGRTEAIVIVLAPVAALIRKGHALRVSIAGADAGNLERLPALGTPTLTVQRNAALCSYLEIQTLARVEGTEGIPTVRVDDSMRDAVLYAPFL